MYRDLYEANKDALSSDSRRGGEESWMKSLKYFYGESENAIKIQIWTTLIANLILTLLQKRLKRRWSFSGLATMVRIVLMYYINFDTFFESLDEDLKRLLTECPESPPSCNNYC